MPSSTATEQSPLCAVAMATKTVPIKSWPVVGIGASAGGLEAFTQLIEHLPLDSGMTFVLVQHMDPSHESLLPKLLSKVTAMPIHQIQEGMKIEPNQVYIIPPNTRMALAGEQLHLSPRSQTAPHMPIDFFFGHWRKLKKKTR